MIAPDQPARAGSEIEPAVLAAIVAAVDACWPQPGLTVVPLVPAEPVRWRFSSRWWAQPTASRRLRPW